MKIGILTFHYAHNYGAMLQAYGLSTKLNLLGYNAEIVDYRLPYIYKNHEKLDFRLFYQKYRNNNNFIVSFLKALRNYRKHCNRDHKWYNFESFLNDSLKISSRRIYSPDLSVLPYDVYICGSDQIWNTHLTGGIQPIYFGYSAKQCTRKIAYAASNGRGEIDNSDLICFLSYLNNLDAVGLREESLAAFLRGKTNLKIETVLDPVFLLNKDEWNLISNKPLETNYLLSYSFNENEDFFPIVRSVGQRLNLKIVRFCFRIDEKLDKSILQISTGGPKEFLGYFENASFVITNSFHGTAFSLLFNKLFYSVPPRKYRERIDSVLSIFDLSNRIVDSILDINLKDDIDYALVETKMELLRKKSISYLTETLNK